MDSRELRSLQAPLKEQYKTSPENAVTPARAEAVIEDNDISCQISTYAGTTVAGLHPEPAATAQKPAQQIC
jgi:hypothetical protein